MIFISALALIGLVLYKLVRLLSSIDCDLTLWFYCLFGKSIGKLRGKVIWITGASSGIGEALAYELAGVGAKLVLSGTDSNRLEKVKERCIQEFVANSRDVLCLPFDITSLELHQKLLHEVIKHFERIDVLINNAGRSQRALFHETDISVDREMFNINVIGPINLTRVVLNHWYATGSSGHLVVTSSTLGKLGVPNGSSYAATKHAMHGYFECIRSEAHSKGVRVTMTCPGPVFSRAAERAFTGTPGKTFGLQHNDTTKRMATSHCARLIAIAIVNQLSEVWICFQPILYLYYLVQYLPGTARLIFPRLMTAERVAKLREGQ